MPLVTDESQIPNRGRPPESERLANAESLGADGPPPEAPEAEPRAAGVSRNGKPLGPKRKPDAAPKRIKPDKLPKSFSQAGVSESLGETIPSDSDIVSHGNRPNPFGEGPHGQIRAVKLTREQLRLALNAICHLSGYAEQGNHAAKKVDSEAVVLSIPSGVDGHHRECLLLPEYFIVKAYRAE